VWVLDQTVAERSKERNLRGLVTERTRVEEGIVPPSLKGGGPKRNRERRLMKKREGVRLSWKREGKLRRRN